MSAQPMVAPAPHTFATHPGPVHVLLAHALYMALDPKQVAKIRPFPPLGTLYAAAHLKRLGYRVAVFDAMLAPGPEAFEEALDACRPEVVAIYEDSFNFLSKMCLARMRAAAAAMLGAARARGLPVLVCGSDASDAPEVYLGAGAAGVILGEGEHTLAEAMAVLVSAGHASLSDIAGMATRSESGDVVRGPARGPERKPDVFAWPDRSLVDIDAYRRRWVQAHGQFTLNMVSTRGCPFHCNWCAKPIWGQRYAMRSAAEVAAEMADVKRTLRPDRIWFADDIFGLRPDWVAEFGAAVEALDAHIPFQIQSRVDLITDVAADGLARAGCAEVWLGVESGSQRILDAMDKGTRVEDIPPAVDRLRSRGIRVAFFLQFGYPGETWDDIRATVALVRSTVPDDIGISVSYPLPGTRFHTMVASELGPEQHWSDSQDLAMLFQGTYTSDFYRALHRALHLDLELMKAMRGAAGDADGVPIARSLHEELATAWAEVEHLERTGRSPRPTPVAPTAEARPAPDLSAEAN